MIDGTVSEPIELTESECKAVAGGSIGSHNHHSIVQNNVANIGNGNSVTNSGSGSVYIGTSNTVSQTNSNSGNLS